MQFRFDATTVVPNAGQAVEKWAIGYHPVVIRSADIKPIQNKPNSARLSLKVEAIDGPEKGKVNYIGLNIQHDNPEVVRISFEQFSAICWCVNKIRIETIDELFNIPFVAFATQTDRGNNFEAFQNMQRVPAIEIARAAGMPMGGGGAPTNQPAAAPAQSWGAQPAGNQPAAGGWGATASATANPAANQPAWGAKPADTPPAGGAGAGWAGAGATPAWGAGGAAPASGGAPAWGAGR